MSFVESLNIYKEIIPLRNSFREHRRFIDGMPDIKTQHSMKIRNGQISLRHSFSDNPVDLKIISTISLPSGYLSWNAGLTPRNQCN